VLYLYALAAAAASVAFVVWRMRAPADLRLNRRYLGRYLKDSDGRGPSQVKLTRVPAWLPAAELDELVYYHVQAQFADGSQQEATVQVLYPLESLQREREQKQKPSMAEDFNPLQNPAGLGGQRTPADEANKFKEDPLSELSEERRLIEQKTAQFDREVAELRRINSQSDLFPHLIAYDRAKHIAVLGSVGVRRLDMGMNEGKREECKQLLPSFLARLAAFHALGDELALNLPDKGAHSEQIIRGQITEALRALSLGGVLATTPPLAEVIAATSPIWTAGAAYLGPRLPDASPRGLFVHGGQARPLNYGRLRRDITLLDVIELLCDPAMPLSPEEELSLIKHYLAARFPGAALQDVARQDAGDGMCQDTMDAVGQDTMDAVGQDTMDAVGQDTMAAMRQDAVDAVRQDAVLLETLRLAIYYRLVLAKHLAEYFSVLKRSPHEKHASLSIPYWTDEAESRNFAALRFYLSQDSNLTSLLQALPR